MSCLLRPAATLPASNPASAGLWSSTACRCSTERSGEGGIEHVELPMLRTILTPLVATNVLPGVAVEPLVHVALGGLYGAALFIARSPEPDAARGEVDVVLDTLIGGLRTRVSSPAE
jgi:tetracycline repressor-like protein